MAENEWITSSEGAELLGVDQPNFLYYAKKGDIAIKPGTRTRERLYSRADTLKIRQKLARRKRPKPEAPLVDWVLTSDIPAALRLLQALYHEDVDLAELAVYQSWRKNNNQLTMGAFSQDRQQCYASLQVLPLPERVILDILNGTRPENSIVPDEIETYERSGAYTLLVTSATVLPERPALLYAILEKYIEFWIEQYPERYIKRVYAQAVSEDGMRLIQHFFMAPRPELAYNAFMLDMSWPATAKMIKKYKQAIAEKAPLLPDLLWHPPGQQPEAPQQHQDSHPEEIDAMAPERAKLTPAQNPPATSRTATVSRSHTQKEALPEGYVSTEGFAKRHGIAPTTVRKAISSGRLQTSTNDWVSGRAPVKVALNPEQQRAFLEMYQSNPNFHQCELDDCPCHDKP